MSKWCGIVGYATTREAEPGLFIEDEIVERRYYGDAISTRWKRQAVGVNDDITISETISVMADEFAYQHCSEIVYVEYRGTRWKVVDVDPQRPRLNLTLGGVYSYE